MNELPRQKLCEMIRTYGESLCDEPLRLEGLLRDLCGKYRLEINLFVHALKEGVATDLRNSSVSAHTDLLIGRLSKRLQDHHAVTEETARWVVESWALALGKMSEDELSSKAVGTTLKIPAPAPTSSQSLPLTCPVVTDKQEPVVPAAGPPESREEKFATKMLIIIGLVLVAIIVAIAGGFLTTTYDVQKGESGASSPAPDATVREAASPAATREPQSAPPATPATAASGTADNLIVPGQRIGLISIGMPSKTVFKLLGRTNQTIRFKDVIVYEFPAKGLNVEIADSTSRVDMLVGMNSRFATVEGVHPGDPESSIIAKLGWPIKKQSTGDVSNVRGNKKEPSWRYIYKGMIVCTLSGESGEISAIIVKRD